MLKGVVFCLLIVVAILFYAAGYTHSFEFGQNTMFFSFLYGIMWINMLIMFLLIPKKWGSWYRAMLVGYCCLFCIELGVQFYDRSHGQVPDNDIYAIITCACISITAGIIYANQKRWKDWTFGRNSRG